MFTETRSHMQVTQHDGSRGHPTVLGRRQASPHHQWWSLWPWSLEGDAFLSTCHNGFLEAPHSILHGDLSEGGLMGGTWTLYPKIYYVKTVSDFFGQQTLKLGHCPNIK